jgi:hypothetical protein
MLGLGTVVALMAFLVACGGGEQPMDSIQGTSAAALGGTGAPEGMIVYSPRGKSVSEAGFAWMGPVESMGGQVLEGEPKIYARIDYSRDNQTAGIFKATTGKIQVRFPFSEHATILEGEVTITDESGQSHLYKAGDSYFIRQGQVVIWEVKGKQVLKSFFNIVEAQ